MANLGDNNTPVEGESFGLPSGFSIDENNGNLAIRDTNGNVVAEWDDTNAQWDFANNTLNNVDALNSNSVNTEQASSPNGDRWDPIGNDDDDDDTSNLDLVVDNLDQYDRYRIEVELSRQGEFDTNVELRINELDSQDYNNIFLTDAIESSDDDDAWLLVNNLSAGVATGGTWTILDHQDRPSIFGAASSAIGTSRKKLIQGTLTVDANLNKIEIFSDSETTGSLLVEGRDMP